MISVSQYMYISKSSLLFSLCTYSFYIKEVFCFFFSPHCTLHPLKYLGQHVLVPNEKYTYTYVGFGLPWWLSGKESSRQCWRGRFNPCVRKIPWRRKRQSTPVFLPGKSHGQGSLVGYSPWGHKRVEHDLLTKQQRCRV